MRDQLLHFAFLDQLRLFEEQRFHRICIDALKPLVEVIQLFAKSNAVAAEFIQLGLFRNTIEKKASGRKTAPCDDAPPALADPTGSPLSEKYRPHCLLLVFSILLSHSRCAEQVLKREPSRVVGPHFHGTRLAQMNRQGPAFRLLCDMDNSFFCRANIAFHT